MINDDSLIILSVNKSTSLPEGTLAIKLEVEHRRKRRSIGHLNYLSQNDFDELKSFLLNAKEVCTRERSLPIVEDVLELQYAISLLKEHVLDFSVAGILRLYKSNKKISMPLVYLRKLITRLRRIDRNAEARAYSMLLRRLQEYSSDVTSLDLTMMDTHWFEGFRRYLKSLKYSGEKISDCMALLWQVYKDLCKMSGGKMISPVQGCNLGNFLNVDFLCSLTQEDIEKLFEIPIEDENLVAARNLLALRHWNAEMAFIDLLDLKMEDVHSSGIWYRRRIDNRLCFSKQPPEIINTIRTEMNRGENILFPSPFEKMKDDGRGLDLKMKFYMQQIWRFAELYRINLDELNTNLYAEA